ncbi:MAG: ATP-binding protein [Proteobacteria bacterium]|nr:ATP-binding protein [Pseudomonadota bacterium]
MVITDVRMPRGDGLSLAVAIRELSPATPITVITGHGSEQLVIVALRAGVIDFIKKPVRLEDLSAALLRMEAARELARRERVRLPRAARLLEHSWIFELGNDLEAIPAFVDVVLSTCAADLPQPQLVELNLALREVVLNAVEHGNLGLTFAEKARALELGTLPQVLAARAAELPYAARHARLTIRRLVDSLEIEVADEGSGFNWQGLPDPTDPDNLLAAHGRGILLAQLSVDRLSFNAEGNRAILRKQLRSPAWPT